MKVRKIDISEKLLEVRDGTPIYWEAEFDPSMIMVKTQGDIPDQVTVKQNGYHIRQIFKPGKAGYEKEYVAVKLDSRGLFEDLIQVSNDVLETKTRNAREDGYWEGEHKGFQKGEEHMLEAFRALPWYKRLFRKY